MIKHHRSNAGNNCKECDKAELTFRILYLTQNLLWENEAEREVKGLPFINPDNLKRICDYIETVLIK